MAKLDPSHPWGTDDGEFACRPIFSRLPAENYGYRTDETEELAQDPSNWLTDFPDDQLCQIKYQLFNFYELYLDCETAKVEVLDWLAQLHGFTGEYWSADWPENFKRALLCNSYEIWLNKGTEWLFNWFLTQYNLQTCTDPVKVWRCQDFLAGESRTDAAIKMNALESFIRLPLGVYGPETEEWKLVRRWIRQYMPAYAIVVMCFCYFYANFSRTGDGVFDSVLERSQGQVPAGINYVREYAIQNEGLSLSNPLRYFAGLLAHLLFVLRISGEVTFLEFKAGETAIPSPLGVNDEPGGIPYQQNPAVFIRVSPSDELYQNYQTSWQERERLVQLYRPFQEMWEVSVVCHDYFYSDRSGPSHPEFDVVLDASRNAAIVFHSLHSELASTQPIPYFVQLLTHLGSLLTLPGQIGVRKDFQAGVTAIPAPIGGNGEENQQVFWRIEPPENYAEYDRDWQTRERLVQLYRPFQEMWEVNVVCHDYFRAGMSAPSHPVFDDIWEATIDEVVQFYQNNQQVADTDPWEYFYRLLGYLVNLYGIAHTLTLTKLSADIQISLTPDATIEIEQFLVRIYNLYRPFI